MFSRACPRTQHPAARSAPSRRATCPIATRPSPCVSHPSHASLTPLVCSPDAKTRKVCVITPQEASDGVTAKMSKASTCGNANAHFRCGIASELLRILLRLLGHGASPGGPHCLDNGPIQPKNADRAPGVSGNAAGACCRRNRCRLGYVICPRQLRGSRSTPCSRAGAGCLRHGAR